MQAISRLEQESRLDRVVSAGQRAAAGQSPEGRLKGDAVEARAPPAVQGPGTVGGSVLGRRAVAREDYGPMSGQNWRIEAGASGFMPLLAKRV